MAFPTSPINGQIALVDGISYTYNSAYNSWKRQTVNFSSANTISNSAIVKVDTFIGNGSTTSFTLSVTPPSSNYISVSIDGATQLHSSYSLLGNILTLSAAPNLNENIEVTSWVNGSAGVYLSSAYVYDSTNKIWYSCDPSNSSVNFNSTLLNLPNLTYSGTSYTQALKMTSSTQVINWVMDTAPTIPIIYVELSTISSPFIS